jgi:carboxylesterase
VELATRVSGGGRLAGAMVDVVVLHGLGGTPATVEPLAVALRQDGWSVDAPLLPGHDGQPEDLLGVTWEGWLRAVPPARVAIGQSFGGTVALASGATHGIVCINAVAFADPDAVLEGDWIDAGEPDIRAPGVSEPGAYRRLPVSALREMTRGVGSLDLASITVPVLVVTSADDAVVDPYHSDVVASTVSGPVERLSLPRSGHVATLDLDAALLVERVCGFVTTCLRGREGGTARVV